MISVWCREQFFQVAFQNALAQVDGAGGMAGEPFVVLAHVQQHRLGVLGESGPRLRHADFVHMTLRLADNF